MLALLLALGVAVQALGASLYWDTHLRIIQKIRDQTGAASWWSPDHLPDSYFVPQFSPVWGHIWLLKHMWQNDPNLNRDPPWRNLIVKKIDLKDAWERLRIDWWGADWADERHATVGLGMFLLLYSLTFASGWALGRRMRARSWTG
jgi:hypothetical protein